jgi:hypothetical protein
MSKASVLLPEPDTPVTTVNLSRGMSTFRLFRLCSRALTMRMSLPAACLAASRRALATSAAAGLPRAVSTDAQRGVVVAQAPCRCGRSDAPSHPPACLRRTPAGPRRHRPRGRGRQSSRLLRITSRLCSITISECPASSSLRRLRISLAMSSKCRPVVGSSNRNSVPFLARRLLLGPWLRPARKPASFRRCASPPLRASAPAGPASHIPGPRRR